MVLSLRSLLLLAWLGIVAAPAFPIRFSDIVEGSVMNLLTQARSKRGLTPFNWDPCLASAARLHSQNMAKFNFFDHDSPVKNQREVNDRVRFVGGQDGNFGENIYWCSGLPQNRVGASVIAEWLSSAEHRDTLLSPEYSYAGVGAYQRGKECWVTLICRE